MYFEFVFWQTWPWGLSHVKQSMHDRTPVIWNPETSTKSPPYQFISWIPNNINLWKRKQTLWLSVTKIHHFLQKMSTFCICLSVCYVLSSLPQELDLDKVCPPKMYPRNLYPHLNNYIQSELSSGGATARYWKPKRYPSELSFLTQPTIQSGSAARRTAKGLVLIMKMITMFRVGVALGGRCIRALATERGSSGGCGLNLL